MYTVNPRETAKNIFKRGLNNKSIGKIKWNNKKILNEHKKSQEKEKKKQRTDRTSELT